MQQNYQQLLTDAIKKQIIILGPNITLAKARNVKGLVVADDGTVTDISGNPQEITQALVGQFVQLSGEIVKKTMESLLMGTVDSNQIPQPAVTVPAPLQMPSAPIQVTPPTQPSSMPNTSTQPVPNTQ